MSFLNFIDLNSRLYVHYVCVMLVYKYDSGHLNVGEILICL